ncbi:MAG: hypothetical protein IPK82_37760 [Polyangiaceae bacterium]|nr:hypothetical protein [Polyangiaceae bacterium]
MSMGIQPESYAGVVLHSLSVLDEAISGLIGVIGNKEALGDDKTGGEVLTELETYFSQESNKVLAYQLAEKLYAPMGPRGLSRLVLYMLKQNVLNAAVKRGHAFRARNQAENEYQKADKLVVEASQKVQNHGNEHVPQKILALSNRSAAKKKLDLAQTTYDEANKAVNLTIVNKYKDGLKDVKNPEKGFDSQPVKSSPPSEQVSLRLLAGVIQVANISVEQVLKLGEEIPFPRAYQFAAESLINNVKKGQFLLKASNNPGELTAEHFASKALVLIDNLLETLILFRTFSGLNVQGANPEALIQKKLASDFQVPGLFIRVVRTDSGEQAGALSILGFEAEMKDLKEKPHIALDDPYFELPSAVGELVKGDRATQSNVQDAPKGPTTTILADIHPGTANLKNAKGVLPTKKRFLQLVQLAAEKKSRHLSVDITNADIFEPKVLEGIAAWCETFKDSKDTPRLVLFTSLLKHKEFGLDKYQAGRMFIFTFSPEPENEPKTKFDEVVS